MLARIECVQHKKRIDVDKNGASAEAGGSNKGQVKSEVSRVKRGSAAALHAQVNKNKGATSSDSSGSGRRRFYLLP